MNIAIVGPGKLGSALGKLWIAKGHHVTLCFGRDAAKQQVTATEIGAQVASVKDAVANSAVVLLATKWAAVPAALAEAGSLRDKVLVDCTNTMSPRKTAEGIPEVRSCAEVLAAMPETEGAHVVKALNQVFVEVLRAESRLFGEGKPTQFLAGDDEAAKKTVASLIEAADMEAVDAGPLENARQVEAFAVMMLRLGHTLGLGTNIAVRLMRR